MNRVKVLILGLCLLLASDVPLAIPRHSNGLPLADEWRVFDAYGDLPFEHEKERLRAFSVYLRAEPPGARAYIIVYAGRCSYRGEAKRRAERAKSYLVSGLGVKAERVVALDGGYREELRVELWPVPVGAAPPEAKPSLRPSEVRVFRSAKERGRKCPATRA